jgi:hypothetical protein
MKSGYRKSIQSANKKKVKKHLKEFYAIMYDLEEAATEMYTDFPNQVVTEEWMKEIAPEYMDREIDNIEAIVMCSKIWELQNMKNEVGE